MKLFSTVALIVISTFYSNFSNAEEYYGVEWSTEQVQQLRDLNYDPKQVSEIMYRSNDVCSKSVKEIVTKKAKICIQYKCGFTTRFVNIDTYTNDAKAESLGSCGWLN